MQAWSLQWCLEVEAGLSGLDELQERCPFPQTCQTAPSPGASLPLPLARPPAQFYGPCCHWLRVSGWGRVHVQLLVWRFW